MNIVQPIKDRETIEELKGLLSPRDALLVSLGVSTGMKAIELLNLKVRDLSDLTVNSEVREEINNYIKGMDVEAWLFPSRKGDKPISRVQAHRILKEAGKKVGIEDFSTISLRKTFGYFYFQQTGDVKHLQELFSHWSPKVTLEFIGITEKDPS